MRVFDYVGLVEAVAECRDVLEAFNAAEKVVPGGETELGAKREQVVQDSQAGSEDEEEITLAQVAGAQEEPTAPLMSVGLIVVDHITNVLSSIMSSGDIGRGRTTSCRTTQSFTNPAYRSSPFIQLDTLPTLSLPRPCRERSPPQYSSRPQSQQQQQQQHLP